MRILVAGAGGVGGYFGGLLARSGQDVAFLARGPHLQAILENGLQVESAASGDFTVKVEAFERADGPRKADLILFCVKTYSNVEAMEAAAPAVGDGTTILTLQNGITSADELGSAFGREKVLPGLAYIETGIREPGVVAQTGGPCRIVFGELDGEISARAAGLACAFRKAGIEAQASDTILRELWNKFIFICALSGVTSVSRSHMDEVLAVPETSRLLRGVMEETAAVGRARGVDLEEDVVEQTMRRFGEFSSVLRSSMQRDLEAGKPLELEALNGAVARLGAELGIETPVNDFVYASLKPAAVRAMGGSNG